MENNTYSLPIGAQLMQGKYRIVSVLGQGGFGITYKGEHTLLGTAVAIKEFFMKGSCERDEGSTHVTTSQSNSELAKRFRLKFIKEAKMLASLKHPGIIRVFDIFEDNGTAYYVMDFIDGKNLNDIVKTSGRLTESVALKYIRQVADALNYIHQKKLLHLDVKPANILIDKNTGRAILIDFGVSKQYDEAGQQTSTTPPAISRGYSPVEQYAQGNNISSFSPATDIYSLAATLYKLLTGVTPPESNLLLSEEEQLPPYPANVSQATRNAIAQCLQTRKKRPQSIDEFLTLLNPAQQESQKEQEEETITIDQNNSNSHNYNPSDNYDEEQLTIPHYKYAKSKDNLNKILIAVGGLIFLCIAGFLISKCSGSSSANNFDEEYIDSLAEDTAYVEYGDSVVGEDWTDDDTCVSDDYTPYNDSYTNEKNASNAGGNITEGTENYDSGDKFVGQFKNGIRYQGIYYWKNGQRFEGMFKNGKINHGTFYYTNGNRYNGYFDSNEEKSGYGTFYWSDGDRYEGYWANDNMNGEGSYYHSNGNQYNGYWTNGEKSGYGTFYWADGDRYEGNFANDKMSGEGTYYWKDGRKYTGNWANEKRNGYGIQYNADGSVYHKGQWKNGEAI